LREDTTAPEKVLGVDVLHLQMSNFRETQTGGIGGHQEGAKLDLLDRVKEAYYLSLAQDER
jgi:hypothetical protein